MYRNSYKTQTGFAPSQTHQSQYRYTSSNGFNRTPLYPIGPTITQPQFKPVQRGLSPSPYLNNRQSLKPPSYQSRYLQKAQLMANQINLTYEQREKRLIQQNQREIQEEEKRRENIRISYQREIKALNAKLNRNQQRKQKLNDQILNLQKNHEILNQRLAEMRPPQRNNDNLQHIDRKQQQMIILKNRLMTSMRQNQIQLNKKYDQQQKYWQQQITQKQKILFQLQQKLRDKRLQLHLQKQKSLQKPDFLTIQQQVRAAQYQQFLQQYEDLQRRIKFIAQQKQRKNTQIKNLLQLKKPQLHNNNIRRQQIKRQEVNLLIRVKELQRVTEEMEAANLNLMKDLERKQAMVTKYELDIHDLREKKKQAQSQITELLDNARERDGSDLHKSLYDQLSKLNEDIRTQQAKGARLKNAYQKLYELLCSSTSKNIHQTFNETLLS